MKRAIQGLAFVFLALLCTNTFIAPSCSHVGECADTTEYPALVRLSTWTNGMPADKVMDSLFLTLIRESESNVLLYDSVTASLLTFPLNQQAGSTVFIFECREGRDTIRIYHHDFPDLVSYECGLSSVFVVDSAVSTGSVIDSIGIPVPQTNTDLLKDEENIRLYF